MHKYSLKQNSADNISAASFAATHSVIFGGFGNCIGVNSHNVIFGGIDNLLEGNCSAVLGGEGNWDNGFDLVGLFGFQVTGVMPNAFHANNYVIHNMQSGTCPGGVLTPPAIAVGGTLWYFNDGSGNKLYIS